MEKLRYSGLTAGILAGVSLLSLLLGGCNTVYFYETEKVSMTLEARPDPTSPISGNIGIKQRIAAVVPPTKEAQPEEQKEPGERAAKLGNVAVKVKAAKDLESEAAQLMATKPVQARQRKELGRRLAAEALQELRDAQGDALSVGSSFRFHKYPAEKGAVAPRVTIDAALLTGGVAQTVASNGNVNRVMGALTGNDSSARPMALAALGQVYSGLKKIAKEDPLSTAPDRVAALDALITDVPATYPVDVYDEVISAAGVHTLNATAARGTPTPRADFDDVVAYEAQLAKSSKVLHGTVERLGNPTKQSKQLVPAVSAASLTGSTAAMVADGLRKQADDTEEVLRVFRERLTKEPAIAAAIKTFFGE